MKNRCEACHSQIRKGMKFVFVCAECFTSGKESNFDKK